MTSIISDELLMKIRTGMVGLTPPNNHTKVFKDECMFSFDSPFSSNGLFVNLKSFQVIVKFN